MHDTQPSAPLRRAPGPKGRLILGSLPERRRDPIGLFMRSVEQYGDVVFFRMGPLRVFLVNDPAICKYVLQDNRDNFYKGMGYEQLKPVLGLGLLTSEGAHWHRQRRLAQPAFHRERIAALIPPMTQATDSMLDRWRGHEGAGAGERPPFDIAREMMRLTLGIVTRTLLGKDVSGEADEVGHSLSRLLAEANRRALAVTHIGEKLPLPSTLRFKRDLAVLDRVVYGVIRERRAHPGGRGDLLDMLMSAVDEETGQGMDDAALRDEVMTMFLAGHETTANALAWTFYLLSKNPAVERKLRDEVEQVLGGRAPTFEDLAKLRYATMVFQESLRLYPPAWLLPRTVREDDRLGDYAVPKGAIVLLSPYVLHRHPKYWNNPEGFDPERFENEKPGPLQRYTYFPFGAGPRQCIGSAFATMEAQIILARVLQRYRLELVPTRKVEPEALITLRPKDGMWMRIR